MLSPPSEMIVMVQIRLKTEIELSVVHYVTWVWLKYFFNDCSLCFSWSARFLHRSWPYWSSLFFHFFTSYCSLRYWCICFSILSKGFTTFSERFSSLLLFFWWYPNDISMPRKNIYMENSQWKKCFGLFLFGQLYKRSKKLTSWY